MQHLIDADYSQPFLLPPAIEDWVGPEHPARFIRAFVDALDLDAMGISWVEGVGGRPGYSASLLLKIWLYGYYERIRTNRKLESACRNHMGFIWLTGMIVPDHNTLNGFFRANKKSIRNIFKKTVRVAINMELVGFALHAVDGTKIRARAATRSGWSKEKLQQQLEKLDEELAAYEAQVEAEGARDEPSDALPAALGERQALRESVCEALKQLEEAGLKHLHPADEDARVMKCKDENRNAFAYNGQAVADEQEGMLVACDVTQDCNDEEQLNAMLDKVEAETGQCAERTLADTGYATGPEFEKAEKRERGIAVALPRKMRPDPENPYAASNFIYDREHDVCICPHGEALVFTGEHYRKDRGYTQRRYRCTATGCSHREQCTKNKAGRTVSISQYYDVVERQRLRQEAPDVRADLNKRGYLIEPVFAFIKQHLGFRRFTACGLDNVQAQWSLLCATYNLHKLFTYWRKGKLRFEAPSKPGGNGPNRATSAAIRTRSTPQGAHQARNRPSCAWIRPFSRSPALTPAI